MTALATCGPLRLDLDGTVWLCEGDEPEGLGHVEGGPEAGEHWRELQWLEREWAQFTGDWSPTDRLEQEA